MITDLRERLRTELRSPSFHALWLLFAAGMLLRLHLMAQWRPMFLGYPDTSAYLADAVNPSGPFFDPLRVAGYGVFLREMRDLSQELYTVAFVQHAMGVAAAALLYGAARRAGVTNRWAALPAAAAVLLSGSMILIEHALLGESLWLLLVAAGVYAVVRLQATPAARWALVWGLLAGLLFGMSVTVRLPSVFFAPVVFVWLAVFTAGDRRAKVRTIVPVVLASLAVVLAFQNWHKQETGRWGMTLNGPLNIYGRVAPWADCKKFDPPRGTAFLCENTPVAERYWHDWYVFAGSPANLRYGTGSLTAVLPEEGAKAVTSWSRAAIKGQPLDYLHAVGKDLWRLIDPTTPTRNGAVIPGEGVDPDTLVAMFAGPDRDVAGIQAAWPKTGFVRKDIAFDLSVDRHTRPTGWAMVLLLALALVALAAPSRSERRAAWLFTPLAFAGLMGPIFVSLYDWRYVVPMLGFLGAAAGIGAWTVVRRGIDLGERRRARSGQEPEPVPLTDV